MDYEFEGVTGMRTISDRDCETAIGDLLNGPGYHLFESVFDGAEVAEANRIINHHSDTAQAATHFHYLSHKFLVRLLA